VCEAIGVAEAEVYMRLSGKMQNSINAVSLHAVNDFSGVGYIAMVEGKVS